MSSLRERRERLLEIVRRLPDGPGVYIFKDVSGAVAYVGKARRLRERVRSYFARSGDGRRAVRFVDRYVHDIAFISTDSETAAFILENQLVKRHKPAYNVKLRDDKDFLYVKVDRRHAFPALGLARRPKKGAVPIDYHGPFASASALRRTLRMLGGVIPLRDCTDREFASRTRPCLKHEMGRCCAPCVGLVSEEHYAGLLADALDVLEGRCEATLARLEERMASAAADLRFEEAARQRDAIRYLRATTARQEVENLGVDDADVIGLHRAGELAEVVVLAVRRGALVSSANHTFESELPDDELLSGFLLEFYGEGRPVPALLLLPCELPEQDGMASYLSTSRGHAVSVHAPRRGEKERLVALAARNAQDALVVAVEQRGHQRRLLDALAERLGLPAPPETIECYDVSNTGRTAVVASRVVFRHGEPDRARYRHYKMRTLEGQDDYGAMKEVLLRRLRRAASDPLPDLLVVDGGRTHLAVAEEAVAELGLSLPLAALAKGGRRGRAVTLADDEPQERVFLPGRAAPVVLDGRSPEEYLLQRLRDEAHRFAIGHHRKSREKESLGSRLDDVPGIGPVLKKRLLSAFGGTRALARASVDEVAGVKGVGPELARAILDHLAQEG
ncbi:MAG: excinuclease ABC subunit UvrC [Planctomycetes bacterium]|nr:excinuclease ABC subunit UvrC [Planctomycetota bacterium]